MLYTVQEYMNSASGGDDTEEQIQERLGPLVRCQHLSQYWLLMSAYSKDAESMPLAKLLQQLKALLMLRMSVPSATADVLHSEVSKAPPSWALDQRSIVPGSTVHLTWELDINQLRQAAKRSTAGQGIPGVPWLDTPLGRDCV